MTPEKFKFDKDKDYCIDPNGDVHTLQPSEDGFYKLADLQSHVGGYIEIVPSHYEFELTQTHVGYANEEGRLLNLEFNKRASELFGMPLVGSVAIIRRDRLE